MSYDYPTSLATIEKLSISALINAFFKSVFSCQVIFFKVGLKHILTKVLEYFL